MMAATSLNVNTSFAGPISLIFSILYSYSRAVPSAYRYRVLGVTFTDKTPMYILGAFVRFPSCGLEISLTDSVDGSQ
jgi:hypothetical protein